MARHRHREEHANHEAWAIPYGDLVTLLLAFFVVMYAISSVNEGKYRVMADALSSAFGGPPRTISPVTLGETQLRGAAFDRPSMQTAAAKTGPASASPVSVVRVRQQLDMPTFGRQARSDSQGHGASRAQEAAMERDRQLSSLGRQIHEALSELVRQKLVTVRRGQNYLEVEIQSDILFASGVAEPSAVATATVRKLAKVLRDSPNAIRVEGYTDDRPIHTLHFQSNWELSSARAASVVHVLIGEGIRAGRLAVVGFGEHQPIADNRTEAGRNANRRVLLVILAAPAGPDAVLASGPTIALEPAPALTPATGATRGAVIGGIRDADLPAPESTAAQAHATRDIPSSSTSAPGEHRTSRAQGGTSPDAGASVTATRLAPKPGAG